MKNLLILFAILFQSFLFSRAFANGYFSTGIGYISPDEYREDNEINPLPFGLSTVPMISYQSERWRLIGPRLTYHALKGPIGININLGLEGDRYRAHELEQRNNAVVAGASLRLLFLIFRHDSDISKTFNGNINKITIAHRFMVTDNFFIIPRVTKEFVGHSFTDYYYGVDSDEVGEFEEYSPEDSENEIYGLTLTQILNEGSTLTLNITHKVFGDDIANSPTIRLDRYNIWSFFWSFQI